VDGTIPKGGTIPWVGPRVGPTVDDTGSVKPVPGKGLVGPTVSGKGPVWGPRWVTQVQ
jgi:hypothetical protein